MGFMLLGMYPEGRLVLLSGQAHDTRQAALGELARLSKSPDFADWDAEVVVIDTDQGTPVLLVRPDADEPSDSTEGQVTEVLVVEEPDEPREVEVAESEETEEAEEAAEAETGEPSETEEPQQAEEAGETDAAIAAVIMDLETDAVEETVDETAAAAPPEGDEAESVVVEVDSAFAEAVEDTQEQESENTLRDALHRTTKKMEEDGVVAPESVGPAEAGGEVVAESPVAQAAAPAWPWDTGADAASGLDLDGIGAVGDGDDMVRAPGDDDTMAAARPVILGAYDAADVTEPVAEPEPVAESAVESEAPEAVAAPLAEPAVQAGAESATPDQASDFILDLDDIASVTPEAAETGVSGDVADLSALTCDDCVYEPTCPNKGERLPTNCGSFQWK